MTTNGIRIGIIVIRISRECHHKILFMGSYKKKGPLLD
jgi:hypothetical protein